jgi:GMP synthase-like glutamine amidotransferase
MNSEPEIKIGILETGSMSPEQIVRHGTFAIWFERIMSQTSGNFVFETYRAYTDEIPASPDACDAYIITGSPASARDPDLWNQYLSAFLVDASAYCAN